MPYRYGQMQHAYPLIRECHGLVPTGIAVQFGNYECVNSKTGKCVTIEELVDFAADYLKVDYIFWSMQKPFFKENLMPIFKK